MARSRRSVAALLSAVSTTKSARRRFSESGSWARRISAKRWALMPRRRITRSRCSRDGAETTSTKSQRPVPRVSYSSGMSSTISFSHRARRPKGRQYRSAQFAGYLDRAAEPGLKAGPPLMQQHAEAVDGRVSTLFCGGEQGGRKRYIDDVDDDRPLRQQRQVEIQFRL